MANFESYFDEIDACGKGYITYDDIREIDTTLNYGLALSSMHLNLCISDICKIPGQIDKHEFPHVLHDLQRRRATEQAVRWDFKSLDGRDSGRLDLKQTLLLFHMTLGERYSRTAWHTFVTVLAGRETATFDDLRFILCSRYPAVANKVNTDTIKEERIIEENKGMTANEQVEQIIVSQDADHLTKKRRHDENDKTKRLAKRKLQKWNVEGVASLIADSGIDDGSNPSILTSQQIGQPSVGDLIDLVDTKYDAIRRTLFWCMLKADEEKELRSGGRLVAGVDALQGARLSFPGTLHCLMGDAAGDQSAADAAFLARRRQLRERLDDDIAVDLKHRQECYDDFQGETTQYSEMLTQLADRQSDEKAAILDCVRGDLNSAKRLNTVLRYYITYSRQITVSECIVIGDDAFEGIVLALGLSERKQTYKKGARLRNRLFCSKRLSSKLCDGIFLFDYDRVRQEKLAQLRLQRVATNKPLATTIATPTTSADSGSTLSRKLAIIRTVVLKHVDERLCLVDLLHTVSVYKAGRSLSDEQRTTRLTKLRASRTRWRQNSSEFLVTHRRAQIKMLLEGLGICIEDLRQYAMSARGNTSSLSGDKKKPLNINAPSEDELASMLLADLQQKQDEELQQILTELVSKTAAELSDLFTLTLQLRCDAVNDNVASIVLGTFQFTVQEQPVITAMDRKYERLRNLLLVHELVLEHGSTTWLRLSQHDRNRYLSKKKLQRKRMQAVGTSDFTPLYPYSYEKIKLLKTLIGEDKAECYRRICSYQEQEQQLVFQGRHYNDIDKDEQKHKDNAHTKINIIGDLSNRLFTEQDHVIVEMRNEANKPFDESCVESASIAPERYNMLTLVLTRAECQRVNVETDFDIACLSVGLFERVTEDRGQRNETDAERVRHLAELRVERRFTRLEVGIPFEDEEESETVPEKDDLAAWMLGYIMEMTKKHIEERECLLSIIQDSDFHEICEISLSATDNENHQRLLELGNLRDGLSMELELHRERNLTYIDEAAAIQFALRRASASDNADTRNHTIALLSDLQQQQSNEISMAISKIKIMCEADLKVMRMHEIDERQWKTYTGVMRILTRHENSVEEQAILEALDQKYDVLRDKLLTEALIAQLGEEQWRLLSEKQRQQQIMKLKLDEKRLRKQGKLDEMSKLLGDGLLNDQRLRALLGENKIEAEKRMREKLALRKQRREAGMTEQQIDELEKEEDAAFERRRNILQDLQHSYDEERAGLFRSLHAQSDNILAERERQKCLTRLKRESRLADCEQNFENAVLLLDLARKRDISMKENRMHHEQLARSRLRERLAGRLILRDTCLSETEEPSNLIGWQMRIASVMEQTHATELEMLFRVFEDSKTADSLSALADESDAELLAKLDDYIAAYSLWKQSAANIEPQTHSDIYEGAIRVRLEMMSRVMDGGDRQLLEEVKVIMIADLQIRQQIEIDHLTQRLTEKTIVDMKNMYAFETCRFNSRELSNLWKVLQQIEPLGEDELNEIKREDSLVEAMNQKYDSIKDKLLLEVLMKEAGETEWARLSERERQRRLVALKREEKRLRRQGKDDELAALMDGLEQQAQLLRQQLGDTKEDARRHMQYKLECRRRILAEREAEGLSCDNDLIEELVQEEYTEMIEEERKKKRNIFVDLDRHFDDERNALMRDLNSYDTRLDAERRRQLEIAKLRHQGKQLDHENKFDNAMLLIQTAKDQKQQFDIKLSSERERQFALARAKIESRKKNKPDEEPLDLISLRDQQAINEKKIQDGASMQEVLLDLMATQQITEADVLMKLIQRANRDDNIHNMIKNTPQEVGAIVANIMRSLRSAIDRHENVYTEWSNDQMAAIRPTRCLVSSSDEKTCKTYFSKAAKMRQEMEDELLESVALRLQEEKINQYRDHSDYSDERIEDESEVAMVTALQQFQRIRTEMSNDVIAQSSVIELSAMLSEEYHMTTERWLNDLVTSLYAPPSELASPRPVNFDEVADPIFEREKDALIAKSKLGSDVDVDAEMARLIKEHELRVKMQEGSLEEQRLRLNERLAEQRLKRSRIADDSQTANSMLAQARQDQDAIEERNRGDKLTRQQLMNERLQERREKKRLQLEREQEVKEQEAAASRENSEMSLKDNPFSSFKREKTVVDIDLSDSMKEEVFQQLIAQQSTLNSRLSQEQKRREFELKQRLDKMKLRRSSEAAGVIQNAERQRSNLEKVATEDRERNITKTKERVERLRFEKTKTLAVIKHPPPDDEDEDDIVDGAAKAEEIQNLLKAQERNEKTKPNITLDQKDALKKLRQRKKVKNTNN